MKDFIISPPFGNFITHHKCTSVVGTYTLHRRGGWFKKIYRAVLTVRPVEGGWVNNIGLQNPGIRSVKRFRQDRIYSIAAIDTREWDEMIDCLPVGIRIELNLSCPNLTNKTHIEDAQIGKYVQKFPDAILKLSPTDDIYDQADRLVKLGAKYFHIANTLPTPRGGESGARLKDFSLKALKVIKARHPHIKVIGGGGIYSADDVRSYKDAGADYVSLASIWFNPFQALRTLSKF